MKPIRRSHRLADMETIPICIVNLTDAQALEAQLIENLQRKGGHPIQLGMLLIVF